MRRRHLPRHEREAIAEGFANLANGVRLGYARENAALLNKRAASDAPPVAPITIVEAAQMMDVSPANVSARRAVMWQKPSLCENRLVKYFNRLTRTARISDSARLVSRLFPS